MGLITDSAYTYYSSSSDYGNYAYTSLSDIVTNFELAYVGEDKLIPKARRTDILFHAKRGMQEFSYDLLKSVRSIELTVPPSLSLALPQDYVNYVKLSWVDSIGVKHVIYPTTLTSSPSSSPSSPSPSSSTSSLSSSPYSNSYSFPSMSSSVPCDNHYLDYVLEDDHHDDLGGNWTCRRVADGTGDTTECGCEAANAFFI